MGWRCKTGLVLRLRLWGVFVLMLCLLMLSQSGWASPQEASAFKQSLGDLFANSGATRGGKTLTIQTLFDPEAVRAGAEVQLLLQVTVDKGGYIYSVEPQGAHSPNPTSVKLNTRLLTPIGPLQETPPQAVFDGPFNRVLRVHKGIFSFTQRFKVAAQAPPGVHALSGGLSFHICDGDVCSILQGKSFHGSLRVLAGP